MAELLLDADRRSRVQQQLNEVNSAITNLASQPTNADFQTGFAKSLSMLHQAMSGMIESFDPAQKALIHEMDGDKFFISDISKEIAGWNSENSMTPAVTQQNIASFINERQAYIAEITQLQKSMLKLGVSKSSLKEGQAEIGILLPRDLFQNHLDQLIKELGVINLIIRAFSEVTLGTSEPVEIRQISTSDPLFVFGFNFVTIAAIGGAIAWALDTWKSVEEIRKVRSETAKLPDFTEQEIETIFGGKIKETIDNAIEHKVVEILGADGGNQGRKQEQKTYLNWALNSILARVERGMTVEIRFLPPPVPSEIEKNENHALAEAYKSIQEIVPKLVFPKIAGSPVLKLPSAEPPKAPKRA